MGAALQVLGASQQCPFTPFLGEGSPTRIDYGKKGTLIQTSVEFP